MNEILTTFFTLGPASPVRATGRKNLSAPPPPLCLAAAKLAQNTDGTERGAKALHEMPAGETGAWPAVAEVTADGRRWIRHADADLLLDDGSASATRSVRDPAAAKEERVRLWAGCPLARAGPVGSDNGQACKDGGRRRHGAA